MDASMWAFCDLVAGQSPAPAGVASAAMTADLGLSLLIKTLAITGKRPDLMDAARRESARLREAAAEDIAAVHELMRSHDAEAMLRAIEIPMRAARAAAIGIDLSVEAASEVSGLLAADTGAAAALLCGALRAILICVEANLRAQPSEELAAECRTLEARAERMFKRTS